MKFKDMTKHKISGQVPDFGAIFMSDSSTKEECFERKLFGLPYADADFVMKVKAGMVLFLFEYTKRELYGVFEATSDGQMNIVPSAYSSSGKKFPAQVRFGTIWECHQPLSEPEFGKAIRENYFSSYRFNFGLSENQVCRLLWLFDSRRVRVQKLPESTHFNLSSDSNVLRIQSSSTSAAAYSSSSVSGFSHPLSASGSTKVASQKEPENLETDLGDFIPLSSSLDSDNDSSPDRDPRNGIAELSASDGSNLGVKGPYSDNPTKVGNLAVKGLYSDKPTKGCNVFSRLNISWKESSQVQENRMETCKPVLNVMKDLQQMHKPSKDCPQVFENRMKPDKSVLEIMEEVVQKHEKWWVGRQADLTVRKRSVFSRLNVAPKHDFRGDGSWHGLSEELKCRLSSRPCSGEELKCRLSSRPCSGSKEELLRYGYGGDRPFAGLRAEFHTYGSKVDRTFQQYGSTVGRPVHGFGHRKRKANSYKEENEVCVTGRISAFSRLNWASETKLQTSDHQEVKLSERGCITGDQHKKRRVKPLQGNNKSTVVSQQCSANKEKRGERDLLLKKDRTDGNGDTSLSQKGQVSAGSNNGELVGKACYGVGTTTKTLKTYKRRRSISSPIVQDWNQKTFVEDGNAMCSEPSDKAYGGEYGEFLSPKLVVPTETPNENCYQKTSPEKGNAECSEVCTEREASMESGEFLPDKEGVQTENPSITFGSEELDQMEGVAYEGNAETCMEKGRPSTETDGGLESVEVLSHKVSAQTENSSITCAKDDLNKVAGVVEEGNAECFDQSTKTDGAGNTTKTLKTYKRHRSISSPIVQDCNQEISVEEGNAMCSEPSDKAYGGVEYGELLSSKLVVPTENPNENCYQKKIPEKGNAECSEACTEMDSSVESGEFLPDKEGVQTENPSITFGSDEVDQMEGVAYEGNAETCMEKGRPSTETDGGLESVEVLSHKVSAQTENSSITCAKDDLIKVAGVVEEGNAECFDQSTKTDGGTEEHSSPKAGVQAENPYALVGMRTVVVAEGYLGIL